ncbi:transmembrane protein 235 [Takifugu rubripes]|uniref:transmembrane protein 235 n=1 Tax=Takifugu rubripes TaxID=31033 RepID=UPI0011459E9D|nr:transmembrane protein 235-like [Takifugu rubripes]
MRYGVAILSAGFTGLLSFSLLAVAIGSDFWYIINVNNHTGPDDLSSHSGLWRIIEGANRSSVIPSFKANMSSLSEPEQHLLGLHKVVVIMLPLSLVLLVFGWIFGFVSSLVRIPRMLVGSASYILFCSLFTLTGLLVYIQYCNQAMEDFKQVVSLENLTTVDVSFGWSFAIAWLSYSLEVTSSLLLMLAARITQMKHCYDSGMAML